MISSSEYAQGGLCRDDIVYRTLESLKTAGNRDSEKHRAIRSEAASHQIRMLERGMDFDTYEAFLSGTHPLLSRATEAGIDLDYLGTDILRRPEAVEQEKREALKEFRDTPYADTG